MIWKQFEQAAPEIARLGEERLMHLGIALLGTLRQDGSPRIDPIEPFLAQGHLLLGMLRRSKKALDLLRDPRCILHSAVSDPKGSEGEFKLHGRAVAVQDADLWEGYGQAFAERWQSPPPQSFPGHLFSLDIESAAFIGWDIEQGEMTVKLWSPRLGLRETKRRYP